MARAALAKLLLLVILTFIICLPEFFTSYRVSKVNFLCLPYQPCKQENQMSKDGNGKNDEVKKRSNICDPSQDQDHENWEHACTEEIENYTTDSRRGGKHDKMSWFICEPDMNITTLTTNMSSADLQLEVSAVLQLSDTETLNLTLYGCNKHSSLHLHPPEEDDEEEKGDCDGQTEASYCCRHLPPTSKSANQNHCLLWFTNQTVLTATAGEKLPWKRRQKDQWGYVIKGVWLALVCLVLLTILTSLIRHVYRGRHSCKNPILHPAGYSPAARLLNGCCHRAGVSPGLHALSCHITTHHSKNLHPVRHHQLHSPHPACSSSPRWGPVSFSSELPLLPLIARRKQGPSLPQGKTSTQMGFSLGQNLPPLKKLTVKVKQKCCWMEMLRMVILLICIIVFIPPPPWSQRSKLDDQVFFITLSKLQLYLMGSPPTVKCTCFLAVGCWLVTALVYPAEGIIHCGTTPAVSTPWIGLGWSQGWCTCSCGLGTFPTGDGSLVWCFHAWILGAQP